jgi:hypothetical protein
MNACDGIYSTDEDESTEVTRNGFARGDQSNDHLIQQLSNN